MGVFIEEIDYALIHRCFDFKLVTSSRERKPEKFCRVVDTKKPLGWGFIASIWVKDGARTRDLQNHNLAF